MKNLNNKLAKLVLGAFVVTAVTTVGLVGTTMNASAAPEDEWSIVEMGDIDNLTAENLEKMVEEKVNEDLEQLQESKVQDEMDETSKKFVEINQNQVNDSNIDDFEVFDKEMFSNDEEQLSNNDEVFAKKSLWEKMTDKAASAWNVTKGFCSSAYDKAASAWNTTKGYCTSAYNTTKEICTSVGSKAYKVGKNIIIPTAKFTGTVVSDVAYVVIDTVYGTTHMVKGLGEALTGNLKQGLVEDFGRNGVVQVAYGVGNAFKFVGDTSKGIANIYKFINCDNKLDNNLGKNNTYFKVSEPFGMTVEE